MPSKIITHLRVVSDSLTAFQRRLFDQLRTNPYRKHQQQNWKELFHFQQPTNTVNFSALSAMSGSSSFSVDGAFLNLTPFDDKNPSTR